MPLQLCVEKQFTYATRNKEVTNPKDIRPTLYGIVVDYHYKGNTN